MATALLSRRNVRRKASGISTELGSGVPLLNNGYRLAQAEFHRRYEQMPEIRKAELVEGIVFMGSPVSYRHATATQAVLLWLGHYVMATPGVEAADNATLILDAENEFQPDALLRLDSTRGGRSRIEGKYVHGAPELVVEVSVTSVDLDLNDKRRVYRRNGVQEYLVWQLDRNHLDWFRWRDSDYQLHKPSAAGVYRSDVFPGLWLDAAAMLAGNAPRVITQLGKGLASAEHRQFVRRLASR